MTDDSPPPASSQPASSQPASAQPAPAPSAQQVALAAAVAEIDRHLAVGGWDQPARLYALVDTAQLVATEPKLAAALHLTPDAGALTPVEQDSLPSGVALDEWLAGIGWPPEVIGCAVAQEVLALPPSAEVETPADDAEALAWAGSHPARREVRVCVGVLRDGSRRSLLRVRAPLSDGDQPAEPAADDLAVGDDLVPHLADALAATLLN